MTFTPPEPPPKQPRKKASEMSKTMEIEDFVECPQCGVHTMVPDGGSGFFISTHELGDRICLKNQLTSLRAIADQYPKTADGVPITPKMKVWTIEEKVWEWMVAVIGINLAFMTIYIT